MKQHAPHPFYIRALALCAALLLLYTALWAILPRRQYAQYCAALPAGADHIEIETPGFFSFHGVIRMYASDYAALEIRPRLLSGTSVYVLFAGLQQEYCIPVDRELIPLEATNEECEILLDENRPVLLEYLAQAGQLWGF